jgi:hypothetical protein
MEYFEDTPMEPAVPVESICDASQRVNKDFCVEMWFAQQESGNWAVFVHTFDQTGKASINLWGDLSVPAPFVDISIRFETVDGKWQRDIPDYLGFDEADFESVISGFNPVFMDYSCQRQELVEELMLRLYCVPNK